MEIDYESVKNFLHGKRGRVDVCDVEEGDGYEKLTVKQNICYIVAVDAGRGGYMTSSHDLDHSNITAVVVNDHDEVLMVQEAKLSCYKKWYLPAGRMEPNESIVEAVQREVLEEAGLIFKPTSLLCVEECGGRWVRISLVGTIVGGTLKSTDQADEESLQAMWWKREEEIPIRCKDIFPLIEKGVERKNSDPSTHVVQLPALEPQSLLFLRVLVLHKLSCTSDIEECALLLKHNDIEDNGTEKYRVPTTRVHPEDISFREAVKALLLEALKTKESSRRNIITVLGIVNIEHTGQSSSDLDGMGISIIVQCSNDESAIPQCNDGYIWLQMKDVHDESTLSLLQEKLQPKNLIPLRSLKAKL